MVTEDFTLGGEHIMQYTDEVSLNYTLEICDFINKCHLN